MGVLIVAGKGPGPTRDARAGCLDLVRESHVMVLATQGDQGPWSAPLYYVFRDSAFFFFSSPQSRHVTEGENRGCGASIFRDHPDVSKLRGVQMAGKVVAAAGKASMAAAVAYAGRFKITPTGNDILGFFRSAFHARFYRFEPDQVFYMDNEKGFGSREMVIL